MPPTFSHLPLELRQKIYSHILALHPSSSSSIIPISYPSYTPTTHVQPPVTLSLCSEAREWTLRTYQHLCLCLGPEKSTFTFIPVDYEQQTVYITSLTSLRELFCFFFLFLSGQMINTQTVTAPMQLYKSTDSVEIVLSPNHLSTFLYTLSTTPSRHHIVSLALDLRVCK